MKSSSTPVPSAGSAALPKIAVGYGPGSNLLALNERQDASGQYRMAYTTLLIAELAKARLGSAAVSHEWLPGTPLEIASSLFTLPVS